MQLHEELKDDPFIWFAIAKELEKTGAEEKAIIWFEKLVSLAPNEVGTYYHFAQLLSRQKKYKEAFQMILKGKEIGILQKDMHAVSELNRLQFDIEEE
jgi:tetratricopeptide (TPR) repeat protein